VIVASNFLKAQLAEIRTVVSTSYAHERFDLPQERRELMEVTYYVALPFAAAADGIAPAEAIECFSSNAAVMKAEALSRKPGRVGAIAFSRTGDLATGNFGDATVIRKFGDVPDDLSAL
jgi:hypothetical protein